jgi:hypothetical protein
MVGRMDLEIRRHFDPHYVDIRYGIPRASAYCVVPTES